MARPLDPELERRIVRNLDGQLRQGERAPLYRELMRNPAARQAAEDYEANDRLAAAALAAAIPPRPVRDEWDQVQRRLADPLEPDARDVVYRFRPWMRYAVAAAVAGLLVTSLWMSGLLGRRPGLGPTPAPFGGAPMAAVTPPAAPVEPPRADRGSAEFREIIGLVDEQEKTFTLLAVPPTPSRDY